MRPFIIFFTEKEGTTPVVHLLDQFESVSVVHSGGWEPFDVHNCGPMPVRDLERCLRLVYGPSPVDMDALNAIYTRTARSPLVPIESGTSVGFKMRFRPPRTNPFDVPGPRVLAAQLEGVGRIAQRRSFRRRMFEVLREHDVIAFIVVRQDILRWALSKYHGDGTGQPGHMQFELAEGRLDRSEMGAFRVEVPRLESILSSCRDAHATKRRLQDDLEAAGVSTSVLRYEDFLGDPSAYFTRMLETIDAPTASGEVDRVLARGSAFEKVHGDDLRDFVENADEVLDRFGAEFVAW